MDSDHFVAAIPSQPVPEASRSRRALTARERDVLARALRGCDNKVIAYDLGVAHSTVRVLMARAAVKLGARSRPELLAAAAALLGDDRENR